jgi:hypothetical protein
LCIYVDIHSHNFASHANSSSSFCICLPRQKERGKRKFRNGGSGGKRERIERGVKRGRGRRGGETKGEGERGRDSEEGRRKRCLCRGK